MEPLTVLCGNIGWKWPDVWVHRLARMVEKNCSVPYRFICVSDHEIEGIDTREASPVILDPKKPQGCWVILDYFNREISGDGPCISLDLDITIIKDLAPLIRKDMECSINPNGGGMNSSVLAWTPSEKTDNIRPKRGIPYKEFPQGDQEYISSMVPGHGFLPGCYSYKGHLGPDKENLPEDTNIVIFHGRPTPATPAVLEHSWNKHTWDGLIPKDRA